MIKKDDEPLLIKIVAWTLLALFILILIKMYNKTEPVGEVKTDKEIIDLYEQITYKPSPAPEIEVGESEYQRKMAMSVVEANREIFAREIERQIEIVETPIPKSDVMHYAMLRCEEEFGLDQWSSLFQLIDKESSWVVGNINPNGGACGLGQAYPCMKLPEGCLGNIECELNWTFDYIKNRYSNPNGAWNFWLNHNYY